MTEVMLAILLTLPGGAHLAKDRAAIAHKAAKESVRQNGTLGAMTVEETERLLWVWSYYESSWRVDALGDTGNACGLMQVHSSRCDALRKDAVAGMSAGLKLMQDLTEHCKSLNGGLQAYATGRCNGAPRLVKWRCAKARANCE
jgi:hypothetical protein